MSHVTTVNVEVKDLEALKNAAEELGLKYNATATTYKWFGRHVGDYPVPEGMEISDLGKCVASLSIPDNSQAYEVGIIPDKINGGFRLIYDFFNKGYGLEEVIGENCSKLKQEYAVQVAMKAARKQGMMVSRSHRPDGSVVLQARAR